MANRLEVALIIDPGRPYDRRIIRGVAAYVQRHRRDWSLYVEEDPIARLPDLNAWAGDGILANFDDRRIAEAVTSLGVPVVGVGGGYGYYEENPEIPYVRTDNRAIARLAAKHLIDLGFRRFAFCSEPPTRSNGWAKERADAFSECVAEAGFSARCTRDATAPRKQWRRSQAALQKWLVAAAAADWHDGVQRRPGAARAAGLPCRRTAGAGRHRDRGRGQRRHHVRVDPTAADEHRARGDARGV